MMTPAKKHIIYALIAVLISLLILITVYSVIDEETGKTPAPGKAAEQIKEIETPGKKWLNGYLGIFFRFKFLGNLNWLIIPLIIYFFFAVKRPQRWQLGLISVWLLTALFIVIKGYTNYRYQFTLFPFTAAVMLILLWEILKDKKSYLKLSCFSFVALVCAFNIYHYWDRYEFFWGMKVNEEKSRFPYRLLNFLEQDTAFKESAKKVFVMDQPLFFYYTNLKGIDMQSPEAQWATGHLGRKSGSREALFKEFKKILHVEYILLGAGQLKLYNSLMLPEFLDCECRLVLKDNGVFLYRLREKLLARELQSPRFDSYQLWRSKLQEFRNPSSWLVTFVETGEFVYDSTPVWERSKGYNCLTIRGIKPDAKGEYKINFGFEPGRNDLKLDISRVRGRYLHFIARAAISAPLLDKNNFIFISEYNDRDKSWPATRTYFSSPERRTYIVSRQIGKDSSRVIMGFRFAPRSKEDLLLIQNAELYVSDEPL